MDDKKDIDDENEEYHFDTDTDDIAFDDDDFHLTDDEFEEEEESEEDLPEKQGNPISNFIQKLKEDPKRLSMTLILGLFALLVLVYGVMKFIGLFQSSPAQKQTSAQTQGVKSQAGLENVPSLSEPTSNTSPQTQYSAPTSTEAPATINLPPAGNSSPVDAELIQKLAVFQDRIEELERNSATYNEKLTFLEQQNVKNIEQVNSLVKGIQGIESQVLELNNALVTLVAEVKKQDNVGSNSSRHSNKQANSHETDGYQASNDYDAPPPKRASTPARKTSGRGYPAGEKYTVGAEEELEVPYYYVQALIPGRAWLKDSNGKMISVTRGDLISGYGKVVAIDPKKGTVVTSNGTVIEYGIDQF